MKEALVPCPRGDEPPFCQDRNQMKDAIKNPNNDQIAVLLAKSKHRALRRIVTEHGAWYWPAENGTHREGADSLGLEYDRPPGAGDIVTAD